MHIDSDEEDRGLVYMCQIAVNRQLLFVRRAQAANVGKSLACFCFQAELLLNESAV